APYSQNPRVSLLPLFGYGNNIPGRAIFQVHDVLFPGSCVDKSLDPTLPDRMVTKGRRLSPRSLMTLPVFQGLTTSINFIMSLGREIVEVTGPCFSEDSRISCRFDSWLVKGH